MAEEFKRPGWYPDPDGIPGERWWNGSGWSDSRRGGAPAAPAPTVAPRTAPAAPPLSPATPAPPVVYSASNPAPQRPDPYGRPQQLRAAVTARTVDARENRNALVGFITGLIALFAGFFILGPVAIVFSALGINRANQLKAQGKTNTLLALAFVGLGSGILSTILGMGGLVLFVGALFSTS